MAPENDILLNISLLKLVIYHSVRADQDGPHLNYFIYCNQ